MSVKIQEQGSATTLEQVEDRNVGQSIWRGLKRRCPNCGKGSLFRRFLKTHDSCPSCGEEMHHHRADDGPAYLTILIVGHLIVPVILWVEMAYHPPIWLQMSVWLPLAAIMCVLTLEPIKGGFVGLQWALRMHGFSGNEDSGHV